MHRLIACGCYAVQLLMGLALELGSIYQVLDARRLGSSQLVLGLYLCKMQCWRAGDSCCIAPFLGALPDVFQCPCVHCNTSRS